jgi:3-hydroxybutyryl-CoA dehydratase
LGVPVCPAGADGVEQLVSPSGPDAYFAELSVGDRFVSAARTVTETDLVNFAGLSGDYAAIHVDAAAAADGMFGQRVIHGLLTLAIASGLEFSLMRVDASERIVALYAIDRVRLTRPVFIGDTIRLESEIIELAERDAGHGIVTSRQEIRNQRDETVAVLEKRTLHRRRAVAEAGSSAAPGA